MSKVRVYELAKELGLENKALLDLCHQLGMDDKKSHSNSLSDDEAEKVRRFVIRSAMSENKGGVREVSRDGEVLTERRVGGVIRRRKKAAEPDEPVEEEAKEPQADFIEEVGSGPELPSLAPDLAKDKRDRDDALAAADALFGENESAEAAPAAPEPSEPAAVEEVEEPSPVEPSVEEEAAEQAAETPAEPEPVQEDSGEEKKLKEVRKRHDMHAPKVLGRIELPTKPVVEKEEPKQSREKEAASTPDEPQPQKAGKGKKRRERQSGDRNGDFSGGKRPRKKQVLSKNELLDYDGERDGWRGKRDKKKGKSGKSDSGAQQAAGSDAAPVRQKKIVKVDGEISVGEFSKQLGMKAGEVIAKLMSVGTMATINQLIDFDTATLIAEEFGFTAQNTSEDFDAVVNSLFEDDDPESLELRPPVVTVMGHVDHGKTSLLDSIRSTEVTEGEFGGITQHIGAYNVKVPTGGSVTFLDTPGHEAFTAMRSRGAKVTDIVVLVVAADDGVMPQTIEAINHAKAAEVPIIVAINKMDKEDANPDKVTNQLSEYGLVPEDWGGDTLIVKVSAHTREGIDVLLENLHLQAEILELRANPNRRAFGTVVESQLDKGRGPVISVLVQNGTLKKGDAFVAGPVFGKVRALVSDDGRPTDEAAPSIPVEVLGGSATASAGDDFFVIESESQARKIADERAFRKRRREIAASSGVQGVGPLTLEKFSEMVVEGVEVKELPLIIKGDVQGSVEALCGSLLQLSNEEVKIKIIHKGVGAVSENDVQLANASGAIIVAFNVRPDVRATSVIEQEGTDILYSRVIYDLVDNVKAALVGRMAPKFQEKSLGRVEVRTTFKVPKQGVIAGSYVLDGLVPRNSLVRLQRDGVVLYEGKMASLRRFKEDVKEVAAGYECGIGLEGYTDIKDGDVLEVYQVEEVKPVA